MFHSIKTLIIVVITILGIFGLYNQTYAQGHCYRDNWEMRIESGSWNHHVPTQYELSKDQIAQMNEIRAQTSSKYCDCIIS
jgi:ribulose bisphosphate carboxylase small subunit